MIKRLIEKALNCRVYRHSLPRGTDLAYDLNRMRETHPLRTLFDVGANIGQTSTWMRDEFPAARIWAFEPVKKSFDELQQNVAGSAQISCFHLALGATATTTRIYTRSDSRFNSLVPDLNSEGPDAVGSEIVQVETIDGFCAQHNVDRIDLLKVDAEGFDLQVLQGASSFLESGRVSFVLTETGFDEANSRHVLLETMRSFLRAKNFQLFGIYEQTTHPDKGPGIVYCNALFINAGRC